MENLCGLPTLAWDLWLLFLVMTPLLCLQCSRQYSTMIGTVWEHNIDRHMPDACWSNPSRRTIPESPVTSNQSRHRRELETAASEAQLVHTAGVRVTIGSGSSLFGLRRANPLLLVLYGITPPEKATKSRHEASPMAMSTTTTRAAL
ncbi:hypothetical protein QBC38DRAFT_441314 [Podospora fimiseda]|uniref:Uncharacterized protein n=1 Tax=Podospora fimiseda TaxID=252190 RepID=A0AAN7H6P4_9PEZI|nr:hypothetical protein QBC38DRAFT_441314 [Podospora fimiseda]